MAANEKKQLISELAQVHQQLEDLARFPQENPNPVLRVARDGSILFANTACSKLNFNCQPGQLLPEPYLQIAAEVLDSGSSQIIEAEGKNRIFMVNFVPITGAGYVNIYGSDITEHKKTEENLRQTRDYLDNLFTYANAPIIVWNPELEITRFNHAFERLTGRSASEVLGKKVDLLIPADERVEALKKINGTTSGGERWEVVEIPIQHVDGSIRTILWNSATLFDTDGKIPLATIAQGQDITELKAINKMKDEFIGLVSHELRTPLTVVTGAINTAMDKRISEEERYELLEDAAWGAESLDSILNNLLELSRHQAGRLTLDKKTVSIREIADKAALIVGNQHPKHTIRVDISGELPPVIVDPVRLERIFTNLIDNACKYSPEGSEVRVFAQRDRNEIVVGVSDHGVGIAVEDQAGLFEPFSRVGPEARTKGIGLGLVVCKRLVEAHDGRIWVESKPGEGSIFLFTFPLPKPDG